MRIMSMRRLVPAAFALAFALLAVAGCVRRDEMNPFVGPHAVQPLP